MSLNPAMFIPGVALAGAVDGVLHAINVEEETIKEIVSILEEYADALGQSRPASIRESAYGGSSYGQSLGHHTKLAHDHVFDAMTAMMKTLAGTGERVKAYRDDIVFQDEDSADRSRSAMNRYGLGPYAHHPTSDAPVGHGPVQEA